MMMMMPAVQCSVQW